MIKKLLDSLSDTVRESQSIRNAMAVSVVLLTGVATVGSIGAPVTWISALTAGWFLGLLARSNGGKS